MSGAKVFHKSVIGAGHIASGKPCQDYSASLDENGIQLAIVCDGHGGATYVRSDRGARIAVEVAKDLLANFGRCTSNSIFSGKTFSITAKPKRNPFVDADGKKLRYEDLDDTQKQYARQAKAYLEAEPKCQEQQKAISELIDCLYSGWLSEIEKDSIEEPFTRKEEKALNGEPLPKAYGCTLLAFLRTEYYWLALQIGDGSIYCCDKNMSWKKPVPDDCNCFLNYTTSLCDSNPLTEFRYAFNGNGDFPLAAILCSDGVDGSLRTDESLQDFYDQIIGLHIDGDDVDKELTDYLPTLSKNGNKDDISLAGVVDLTNLDIDALKIAMNLKGKKRSISNECRTRKAEIDSIARKIESLEIKFEHQKEARFIKQSELDELRRDIRIKEKDLADVEEKVTAAKNEIKSLKSVLEKKNAEFDNWKFTIKNEMAELEESQNENGKTVAGEKMSDLTNW